MERGTRPSGGASLSHGGCGCAGAAVPRGVFDPEQSRWGHAGVCCSAPWPPAIGFEDSVMGRARGTGDYLEPIGSPDTPGSPSRDPMGSVFAWAGATVVSSLIGHFGCAPHGHTSVFSSFSALRFLGGCEARCGQEENGVQRGCREMRWGQPSGMPWPAGQTASQEP